MSRLPPTMRSRSLERQFRRDGYVIVPAAQPESIARALEVFEEFDSGIHEGYYASIHSMTSEYKRKVDAALTEVLWSGLSEVLADHSSLVAAFMVKAPTGSSVVPLHQDWNTMDESVGAGITCWMPLTPVTEVEGKMRVIPGSHRYLHVLRGSPGFPQPYEEIRDEIGDELLVTLTVEPGEALIMHGRVVHTTDHNRSGRTRVAAYFNALPPGTRPLHYYMTPDGVVEGFWVDREFFTSFNIGERPPGEPFETITDYSVDQLTHRQLRAKADAYRRRRPRAGRVVTSH